jgi:hypothetical protein
MSERTRAYLYRIALAVIPLAQAYGIVNDETAPLIVSLVAAVLATGLATVNTSTERSV